MPSKESRTTLMLMLLLVLSMLILVGCQISWDGELSREAGEQAREEADNLLDNLGDFMSGFCASSSMPLAVIGLVAWRRREE